MTGGVESLGRVRAQGVALLVAAFLVGGLAGAAGERLLHARPGFSGPRPEWRAPGRPMPAFLEHLDLTPEQDAKIREIMERSRPRTDSILQTMMPRLRAVTDSVRREIRAVLTPEQRERLDRELPPERFGGFERMREHRGSRPPSPPPDAAGVPRH